MQDSSAPKPSITLELPKPIADYFAADKDSDGTRLSQCFTENATVKDEGKIYSGRAEIARWKLESTQKYQYTSQPVTSETTEGKTIVTSRVSGNFPGSPINLRYCFTLDGDKIASLEIIS
jgi:hypothetical protein